MPANPNSILDSTKQVLGLEPDYTAFDLDVVMAVNSAFGSLKQLGVGSETGFVITDNTTVWEQYTQDIVFLGMIKQYIAMTVRLAFDPPATSFGLEAIKNQIAELAWRINVEAEHVTLLFEELEDDTMQALYQVKTMNLAMAPTIVPDASVANTFYIFLTGDATIAPPLNGVDGHHITLEIISNGHTVTWSAGWNFGDAGTPTLSTGGREDIISAVYREARSEWRAGYNLGF